MTHLLKNFFVLLALVLTFGANAQTYDDGFTAMQLEDWDSAQKIFEGVTAKEPANQDAWLSLGSVYMAQGEKSKAENAYKAAFEANGDGAKAHVLNARMGIMRNDMATADKEIERATRAGKKDASVFRFIGESFLYAPKGEKPNYTRATEFLKKATSVDSKDYYSLMSLGYCFKEQGDGGQAAQFYELAAYRETKKPLPLYMLAKVYKIAKLPSKALEYLNKTIAIAPNYTRALRTKADYYYFDERNYEEAVKAYKDLVTMGDDVVIEDEMQYANTLFITRDYKNCITEVEKIIKKDPSKTYLRRLLGYCYYETGEYNKGLDVMKNYFKVVEKEKELPSDYLYYGNLQLKTGGDTLQAIQNLKKVVVMDATRWELYKDIGDLYYKLRDLCQAAESYRFRLDSAEASGANIQPLDYYQLGVSWFYCKDDTTNAKYEKALAAFIKVTEKAPTAAIGWFWAGRAAAQLDPDVVNYPELLPEFGKAHSYFEEYVKLASEDKEKNRKDLITALEYLTYYHFAKEEDAEALRLAIELLEINPEDSTAINIKQAIEQGRENGTAPKEGGN